MKPAGDQFLYEMRAEIFRVARLCAPCLDTLGPLTFHGDPRSAEERRRWRDTVWLPVISPAALSAHTAMREGAREIIAVDTLVSTRLVGPLSATSRTAGRQLATSFHAPAGETRLEKFIAAIKRGDSPAHFAVVYSARAAVFHIPAPVMLTSLVFLEMRAAPLGELWQSVADCLGENLPTNQGLRAA
jgi:hypothetical protein